MLSQDTHSLDKFTDPDFLGGCEETKKTIRESRPFSIHANSAHSSAISAYVSDF